MNIGSIVDFFISPHRHSDSKELRRARLYVRACLLTSLFSNSYIWLSVYFQYDKGVYLMIFNVVGFLLIPLLARTKLPITWLGNLYVSIGAFAILVLTYYSGGVWSAIYPWIISIPVLALLVVNKNAGIFWGLVSFGFMIWYAVLALQGMELPVEYNLEDRTLWYVTIVPGLLLIILFISFVFEYTQSKALNELEESNAQLLSQKETIASQSKTLEKLIEEKDYIIRILAHDLRNPLKNITGLAQLLEIEDDAVRVKECTEMIVQSSAKAQHLVNRVLEMDASEQELRSVKLSNIKLNAVLHQVLDILTEAAQLKSIKIKVEDNTTNDVVLAEETYLTLILENLISNAIKFSETNKIVTVKLENEHDTLRVSITDEGPGIEPEEEEMLFKKFSRLSARPTAGESSTGLGLSLVKRYIELIDGKVWYERDASVGATFVVELKTVS
ncbi:sensor histidine kinase [Fulvivirga lutimaris]|uniref:sensor histidine kinase n=1 Tax=Fulvivirga lutimaris TaxID=1819566 RepID=UPI0012BCE691|nr:HAMP domain-containing sensor histidine kinase [Fulvivirga lutimaris]MTI39839.1 HAMP domain-containing histidine kinase [Fulvivirga lutimaris]